MNRCNSGILVKKITWIPSNPLKAENILTLEFETPATKCSQ